MDADLEKHAYHHLIWKMVALILIWILAGGCAAFVLLNLTDERNALVWFCIVLGIGGLFFFLLQRNLQMNRFIDYGLLSGRFNLPDLLQIIRAWMLACLAGFSLIPFIENNLELFPGLVILGAFLIDIASSISTRFAGKRTLLGRALVKWLDFGCLISASLLLVISGRVPIYFLLVPFTRLLFPLSQLLSRRFHKRFIARSFVSFLYEMDVLMLIYIVLALFPIFSKNINTTIALIFMIPYVFVYIQEFLIACKVMPKSRRIKKPDNLLFDLVLLALRISASLFLGLSPAFPSDFSNFLPFMLCMISAAGLFARLGMLGVMGYVGINLSPGISDLSYWIAFCMAGISFILGPGVIAVWSPEGEWIKKMFSEKYIDGLNHFNTMA